jgi:hypothetical protein
MEERGVMSMSEKDIRAKKAAIRKEIKERIQAELDVRKKEIKRRIRREDISLEEKREKYRKESHEEKLRLMERAKEEFRARKRMLGLTPEVEPDTGPEAIPHPPSLPESYGSDEINEEIDAADAFQILEEDEEAFETGKYHPAGGAFVYTEDEEDEERRQYERPISESDIEPFGAEPPETEPAAEPEVAEALPEARSIFYYAANLIIHPVVTLDEFDDYIASRFGLAKVGLFYLVSLLPLILFSMVGDEMGNYMPRGVIGSAISSTVSQQPDPFLIIGQAVLNLLVFSFSIAIINYLVTSQGNFLTLIIYFGFVEAVTRIATYTLILLAVFGVIIIAAQPQLVGIIGGLAILLLIAFIIWTFALNMIVLMSAYDYSLVIAFVLSFAANMVRSIIVHIAIQELGIVFF